MKTFVTALIFSLLYTSASAQVEEPGEEHEYVPISKPASRDSERETDSSATTKELSESNFWQRLRYGGNLQLAFGSLTAVDVSPRIGYQVSEDFIAGIGINTLYIRYAPNILYPGSPEEEFFAYGGTAFGTYSMPLGLPLAVHAEIEGLNFDVYDPFSGETQREWVPGAYIGGGFFQRGLRGGGYYIFVLYNVLHDPARSLYTSPIALRMGFLL